MTYVVNKNAPGFLPESMPIEVETFEEALQAINDEVNRDLDFAFDMVPDEGNPAQLDSIADEDKKFTELIEKVREEFDTNNPPVSVSFAVLNLVYFAQKTEPKL